MKNDVDMEIRNGRQLNVRSLLIRALLRWKLLLIAMAVCGVLGCVYGYRNESNALKAAQEAAAAQTDNAEKNYYDHMLEVYDDMIADSYSYLDKTLLKDMDPYIQPSSTAVLYIKGADDTEIPVTSESNTSDDTKEEYSALSQSNALLAAVYEYADKGISYADLSSSFGADEQFIHELVILKMENGVLTVNTVQEDEDKANALMDYVLAQINDQFNEIKTAAGADSAELVQLSRSSGLRNVEAFDKWMSDRTESLDKLIRARATFVSDYSTQKAVAESIVKTSIDNSAIVKKGIEFALLGLILGFILVVLKLILSGKVLSANELSESFNIRNIAVLDPGKKGLSRKLLDFEPENRSELPDDTRYELAASLIGQLTGNNGSIAVIGDMDEADISRIADSLNTYLSDKNKCAALPSAGSDVEQRKQLAEADHVILAAKIEGSGYSALNDLIVLAENYNKPLIGTIVC